MGEYELGVELRRMYDSAPRGEKAATIHLFGIRFWKEISEKKLSKKAILQAAGIPVTYAVEINKGVNLGKYVTINDRAIWF